LNAFGRVGRVKKRKLPREHTELGNTYKVKRKDRAAIIKAKAQAWQELIDSVNRDPWGLPYKLVLGKLKPAAQALTELLDPENLGELLDSFECHSGQ